MGQDQRAPFLTALERARAAAYPVGEYVGQESFMRGSGVRTLAHQIRIGPRHLSARSVLRGGRPGRMITAESGCRYLGVDHSASALATAQELAGNLPCRFDPLHALRTSATIVALMAKKVVYGMTSVAPVDPGRLSI